MQQTQTQQRQQQLLQLDLLYSSSPPTPPSPIHAGGVIHNYTTTSNNSNTTHQHHHQQQQSPQSSSSNSTLMHSNAHNMAGVVAGSSRVFGPYKLLRTVGKGEYGKVKLAVHIETLEEVAIKFIRRDKVGTPDMMAKLMREVNIIRSLDHQYIVKLIDVLENNVYFGVVLEFAQGGELFDHVLANNYLRESHARRFFAQLIAGVAYMHNCGVVHRDLKLENLLLDKDGNIIISDFGFANVVQGEDSLLSTSCGSPCYAAPELIMSDGYVGEAADIWSCGVILYAMLCGHFPFDDDPTNPDSDNVNQLYRYIVESTLLIPPHVPAQAQSLLRRMLVPEPTERAKMPEIMTHPWMAPVASLFATERKITMQRMQWRPPTQSVPLKGDSSDHVVPIPPQSTSDDAAAASPPLPAAPPVSDKSSFMITPPVTPTSRELSIGSDSKRTSDEDMGVVAETSPRPEGEDAAESFAKQGDDRAVDVYEQKPQVVVQTPQTPPITIPTRSKGLPQLPEDEENEGSPIAETPSTFMSSPSPSSYYTPEPGRVSFAADRDRTLSSSMTSTLNSSRPGTSLRDTASIVSGSTTTARTRTTTNTTTTSTRKSISSSAPTRPSSVFSKETHTARHWIDRDVEMWQYMPPPRVIPASKPRRTRTTSSSPSVSSPTTSSTTTTTPPQSGISVGLREKSFKKLKTHTGPIDHRALTARDPKGLINDVAALLEKKGMTVRWIGEVSLFVIVAGHDVAASGPVKVSQDVVASLPVSFVRRFGFWSSGNNATAPSTTPGAQSRKMETTPVVAGGGGDDADIFSDDEGSGSTPPKAHTAEIRFNVEVKRVKNIEGTVVVDFHRVAGDAWDYKKVYQSVIGELGLGLAGDTSK